MPEMDFTALGHAGWLIEAAGLRLVCDPLLFVDHHGGVFEVHPRRRVRAEQLRADFVLVSHRHPDHFDVPSLALLARLDPDTVVLTPDTLIAATASALGFRSVRVVAPGQLVALAGDLRLVTSESAAGHEWGVMIASEGATAWNMVDTVFRGPAQLAQVRARALAALGHARLDFALVPWQPMLEIAAQLGHAIAFPHAAYAELLDQLADIDAGTIVPGAAGTVHAEPYAWLDAIVCPLDEARFIADARRRHPGMQVLPLVLGGRYRIGPGAVELDDEGGAALIERVLGGPTRPRVALDIPPLVDPLRWLGAPESSAVMQADVARWLADELGPALVRHHDEFEFDLERPLRFAVEVVFADARLLRTLVVGPGSLEVHDMIAPDWDAYDAIAGSMLWEVLQGRRHWGDPLLAGCLRARLRVVANVGEVFFYYALSYAASVERATAWAIEQASDERMRGRT